MLRQQHRFGMAGQLFCPCGRSSERECREIIAALAGASFRSLED